MSAFQGVINLVADCGADPTGVADCAPAFAQAFALATALGLISESAKTSSEIFVPPGVYLMQSSAGLWNMLNQVTSLKIRGCGDASVIKLHNIVGADAFQIANGYQLIIEGLTFVGTSGGVTPDTGGAVIECSMTSPEGSTLIRDCRFLQILSPSIIHGHGTVYLDNCEFCGNSTDNALTGVTWGVVYGTDFQYLELRDCRFIDISALNGSAIPGGFIASNGAFINVQGGPGGPSSQNNGIRLIGCSFDEGCTNHLVVVGGVGGSQPWNAVVVEQCDSNTPINAAGFGPTAAAGAFFFSDVRNVYMRGCYAADATGHTANAYAQCVGVTEAHLYGISINPTTLGNFVTADSTTGTVEFRNIKGVDASRIASPTVLDIDDPTTSAVSLSSGTQKVVVKNIQIYGAVPSAPSVGYTLYVDPTDHKLKAISSGSTISILANP